MFNKYLYFPLLVILSACGANQQQKDQTHLMNKELADKCTAAKIDLAMAEQEKNTKEIHQQIGLINSNCVEEE